MLIAHVIREKGPVVHTLSIEATLAGAAHDLTERRVGALVVLDDAGEIVGVLSERDIVRELARRGPQVLTESVGSVMTRNVVVAGPDETVDDGLSRMTDRRVRHLPVVANGKLVGIVSIGDLVKHRIAAVEAEAAAMQAYIAAH
ncbi:MAG: CBS domain-containing protein [Hyphomonadaceae bacterium]|nr:CBS domain-containing protein [Hyphomonadaceae bacterium]